MMQTLTDYSEGRATMENVVRALVSHHGWLVPIDFAAQGVEHTLVVEGIMILSAEAQMPADELWIFTDQKAALDAQEQGALLGRYAGGFKGTELFRKILPEVKTVRVNPGSPREQTWMFQDGGGIEAAKLWAEAVALEESFAVWQQTGEPDREAVMNYRAFLMLNHATGPVATLPNQFGMKSPAVAFTAPDCAQTFLAKLGEEQRANFQTATIDGRSVIENSAKLGIDGLIFNVFGPGVKYAFPFDDAG